MIHQSYVIHQEYVSEYSYESIKMMNGDVLSVSKPYRKEVRAKIKQVFEGKNCTMHYKIVYELTVVLIVGILHTALLKKVLDTFLPAGDKDRLMWKTFCGILFVDNSRLQCISCIVSL